MNTELKTKKQKIISNFFLMNNAVFCSQKAFKHQTCDNIKKRNYLIAEPNYHTAKFFTENMSAIDMKRNSNSCEQTCLFISTNPKISKIVMYQFWYDYIKPKYEEKVGLCFIYTDSFITYIKAENAQKVLKKELILQTTDCTDHYLKEKIKKVMELMKD